MNLSDEDIREIVAPLRGSRFLRVMMADGTRHCDRCRAETSSALCRRCSRLETSAQEIAARIGRVPR